MKKILYSALLVTSAALTTLPVEAKIIHLLPRPHLLVPAAGQPPFSLGRAVSISDPTACTALSMFFTVHGCTLKSGAAARVTVELVGRIDGAHDYVLADFPNEAYALDISADAVAIKAVTPTGVIRAAQTLAQLAEGYDGGMPALEALSMTDWPAFKLRGFMHDVGRSFVSFDELKKEIDLLARFKVNVFHWHLTEKLAWRFEVKAYPQLTADENMIRYAGQYYTQEQCRELQAYAAERGVTVIPEIDMPGHSDVFTKAMGFSMQTDQGVEALKKILDEVVEAFPDAPYIHIGGDEVRITYPDFLETMARYVRGKGRRVVVWNRLVAGPPTAAMADMTQMWATSGKKVAGLPNIDCRYNYTNHFDVYADLVGIYKSNIYYEQQGNPDVAGTISAAWNDTKTATETDIVRQNNIYANILASAERAWIGGGKQYIETGGTTLPNSGEEFEEFADFERRFLFHKGHSLKDEPIPYVRQTNVRWRITAPFPNGGDKAKVLPPEQFQGDLLPEQFDYEGKTYGTTLATGAGIYLRHIWHPTVPSFYASPAGNQTAYAWTYVYSPAEQEVGAQIEFYTYSRSGSEKAPEAGEWDRRGSRVWLNGKEIPAPVWTQPGVNIPQDHATIGLANENFTARPVVPVTLRKGWNKVFLKLPHVNSGGTGRDKWQFTFVLTDKEGKNAVEGLIYSPVKSIDAAADGVAFLIDEISNFIHANFSGMPGYYPMSLCEGINRKMEEIKATLSQEMSLEERDIQKLRLSDAFGELQAVMADSKVNQPQMSTGTEAYWYALSTPLRGNRYPTSKGAGAGIMGETSRGKSATWKFTARADGSCNIVNAADGTFVSPVAANGTPLKTVTAEPSKGWTLSRADEVGYFIMTSGNVQFHQGNDGRIINWGGGDNVTDVGCKYTIAGVELPPEPQVSNEKTTYWYRFSTPLRENRYPTSKGVGRALVGEAVASRASTWKFVARPDGKINIVNRVDKTFVSPDSDHNTALITVRNEPSDGWEFKPAATDGCFIIVSGTSQFNQTNNAQLGFNVFNYGGGDNVTDSGCQYDFTLVETQDTSTGIDRAEQSSDVGIQVVNGRVSSSVPFQLFTADGRELDAGTRLKTGVYVVNTTVGSVKVVVK